MSDTDPEHEGRDVDAPENRWVVSRVSQSILQEYGEGGDADQEQRDRTQQEKHVAPARGAQCGDNVAGHLRVSQRRLAFLDRRRRMADDGGHVMPWSGVRPWPGT